MATTVQDIQIVRGLRTTVGKEIKLPSSILNSIEIVHTCIKSGTDLNGWKKVDWRDTGRSTGSGGSTSKGSNQVYRSVSGHNSQAVRGNNSFFNNRHASLEQSTGTPSLRREESTTSHYVFNNRSKSGFRERQCQGQGQGQEQPPPVSIPLVNTIVQARCAETIPLSQPLSIPVPNVRIENVTSQDGFRTVPQKYVSKFKKNSENVEDTILNTILLGKLNKFSELNYDEIKEFITHIIDSGQTDMIKCFMKLVFEKAASEEIFCPLYAKLLSELSARYPVLLSEMTNLYSVYMAIFDEVSDTKAENYNEVCLRNVEKKYRRGYSQFLAELIKYNVIDTGIFMKTVTKIITQIENNLKVAEALKLNEEYGDCLIKIMKAIKEDNSDSNTTNMIENIRQSLKTDIIERIQRLTVRNNEYTGLSNKARFTMLDVYERIQKF
jgi:hypothetical protein